MGTSETKPGLVRSQIERPEDVELAKKRAELAELQSRLADLELQLLTVRVELNEFESQARQIVDAAQRDAEQLPYPPEEFALEGVYAE